jgi:hypothetical protein
VAREMRSLLEERVGGWMSPAVAGTAAMVSPSDRVASGTTLGISQHPYGPAGHRPAQRHGRYIEHSTDRLGGTTSPAPGRSAAAPRYIWGWRAREITGGASNGTATCAVPWVPGIDGLKSAWEKRVPLPRGVVRPLAWPEPGTPAGGV